MNTAAKNNILGMQAEVLEELKKSGNGFLLSEFCPSLLE